MAPRVKPISDFVYEMGHQPVDLGGGVGGGFSGFLSYASISDETITNQTLLANFAKKYTIPANTLKVGSVIRTEAWGFWTNAVVDRLTLAFYLHAAPNRLLFTSPGGTIGFATADAGIRPWHGRSETIVRTAGASGNYSYGSVAYDGTANFSAGGAAVVAYSDYGNLDTTLDRDIRVAACVTPTADAGNSIQLTGFTVEVLQAQTTS